MVTGETKEIQIWIPKQTKKVSQHITVSLSEVFTSMTSLIQLLCVSCCGQEAILSGVFVILLSFRTSCGWTNYTIHPGVCVCDNPPVPDCLVDQGAI